MATNARKRLLSWKKNWEVLIDVDKLAEEENESWVFKGARVEPENAERALVKLSRGGKDASILREYDLVKKEFVKDGFRLSEAKFSYDWVGPDALAVATDFGEGSLTKSGYPRILKLWQREQKLEEAEVIFAMSVDDTFLFPFYNHKTKKLHFIQTPVWYQDNLYHYDLESKKVSKYNLPLYVEYKESFKGKALFLTRQDTTIGGNAFKEGDLFAVDAEQILDNKVISSLVYRPKENQAIEFVTATKSKLVLGLLEDVKSKVYAFDWQDSHWQSSEIKFSGEMLNFSLSWTSADYDYLFLRLESFLNPSTLYKVDVKEEIIVKIQALRDYFDASKYQSQQFFSTSKDGEKIPYFMVAKKDLNLDGTNPVLISAYGGFMVSRKPSYLSSYGKLWLDKGGVYVLANIRGGGEYGPKWHKAALREKRQNAFNDLFSVAEDLIARGVSSKQKLAFRGGSNGGLLAGVALTQRPDLFKAIVIAVPLLDMKRYHKLLAGDSWVGEYGNPDIKEDWDFISKYSPYQNISKQADYPKALIWTSTKDDRVHPAHARKMVARLEEYAHPVYYYENIEGGHGGAANNKQQAAIAAMTFSYLYEELGMSSPQ